MSIPNLLDMPEIVMDSIVGYLDVKAIQTLRKVCHDLRTYIDDSNLDLKLRIIRVGINEGIVEIRYDYHFTILYEEKETGCLVNGRFLENENFNEIAAKDLELILRDQKSPLECFYLVNHSQSSSFPEIILTILKSRPHQLQTEFFHMVSIDQDPSAEIFKCLNPKFLKAIEFRDRYEHNSAMETFEKFAETEQWKNAESIQINGFVELSNFPEHFGHFTDIDLRVRELSANDLVMLKNMFIASKTLETVEIEYRRFPENQPYGRPEIHQGRELDDRYWYYNIPGSKEVLRIKQDNVSGILSLERREKSDSIRYFIQ